MIVYHGSENPDITQFRTDAAKFSLLGEGVYFYRKKESAKMYGKYIYKVNIPSSLRIALTGFNFNDNQVEGIFTNLRIPVEQWASKPSGAWNPVWWGTDGWAFYELDRAATVNLITLVMKHMGFKGMRANYPKGGEVVVVWEGYDRLQPELMVDDRQIASELVKVAKVLIAR